MNAEQANVVYERQRELILANPNFGFDLDVCPKCGMDHGKVEGQGELTEEPKVKPIGWEQPEFLLRCVVCHTPMQKVTADGMTRYMDVIASILMWLDLIRLGVWQPPE